MKKLGVKRKQVFLFVLYFLISFSVVDYCIINYFPFPVSQKIDNSDTDTIILYKVPSFPSICEKIKDISVKGEVVTIHFDSGMPTKNESIILSHFALATKWLTSDIFFPLGSGIIVGNTPSSLSIKFFLPIIDNYSSNLFCAAPKTNLPPTLESLRPHILSKYIIEMESKDFELDVIGNDYSKMRCHHKKVFETRWCEFRNIAYFDTHFFFFSPAHFSVPEPFLVPGPRAPPFDKENDRFINEPIVIQFKASTVPRDLETVTDFCYIYGDFHNYYMLWHFAFDFLIPLYSFIRMLNAGDSRVTRRVYVRSDGVWAFNALMKGVVSQPVKIIDEENPSILMQKGTFGIEKLEKNPNPKRTVDDSISFQYNFNRSTALGLREDILRELNIPSDEIGKNEKPLVILIDRGPNSRNVQNIQEIYQLMVETCPFCNIERTLLHLMDVDDQIKLISKASALVGLHGSGLAHVLWMAESKENHTTHLVELLPYKYSCRNWYHTAADCAGVEYHPVMNKKPPNVVSNPTLITCWGREKFCPTVLCHDLLRDQPTELELDTFLETWNPIVEKLKTTIVTNKKEFV